jgi:hypothetical protein
MNNIRLKRSLIVAVSLGFGALIYWNTQTSRFSDLRLVKDMVGPEVSGLSSIQQQAESIDVPTPKQVPLTGGQPSQVARQKSDLSISSPGNGRESQGAQNDGIPMGSRSPQMLSSSRGEAANGIAEWQQTYQEWSAEDLRERLEQIETSLAEQRLLERANQGDLDQQERIYLSSLLDQEVAVRLSQIHRKIDTL